MSSLPKERWSFSTKSLNHSRSNYDILLVNYIFSRTNNDGVQSKRNSASGTYIVDASTPSANVLIVNPNEEEVVLPCGSRVGRLVPVSAVSVARSELRLPTNTAVV